MRRIYFAFFLLLSLPVFAEEAWNLTITNLGVQGASGGYFRVAQPLASACLFDAIYFANNNQLSALLAAKMAGKKLSRLNYTKAADGSCNAVLIEIE